MPTALELSYAILKHTLDKPYASDKVATHPEQSVLQYGAPGETRTPTPRGTSS